MKKIMPAILLSAAFLFAAIAQGAEKTEGLSGKIRDAYSAMKAFRGEFSQTLLHKESGSREKRSGSLVFQKPLLARWETAKPNAETLVITGKEIWDYLPDEEIAYRYPMSLAQDSRSVIQVLTGQAALSDDFKIKRQGKENNLEKYALFPKEPSPQMVEADIWVDPATGYIRRAKIIDFYGNENDLTFNSFTPADKIDPGQFKFAPPKGVEVEDRRDSQIMEKELFK